MAHDEGSAKAAAKFIEVYMAKSISVITISKRSSGL
jgi:hypothetical protein